MRCYGEDDPLSYRPRLLKRFTTEGTEFYFVNSAYGAVNNKELFSVLSVVKYFDVVFEYI